MSVLKQVAKQTVGRSVAMTSISGVIIRADGTREDLGVMAYYNKNPLLRWKFNISQWLRLKRARRITFGAAK